MTGSAIGLREATDLLANRKVIGWCEGFRFEWRLVRAADGNGRQGNEGERTWRDHRYGVSVAVDHGPQLSVGGDEPHLTTLRAATGSCARTEAALAMIDKLQTR